MDSVTQAVLGASICGSLLGRQYGRKAVLSGAIIATLPDLDVFIRYGDPITSMVSHRGFSHSLFVLSALGILVTILWRLLFPHARASAGRVGLAVWLALITHPLLDAFTSYGTQLFWPLAATPATWSSIFIIDPLYTLPLLIATLVGLARGAAPATLRACNWALLLSSLYLAASVGAKFWAEQQATTQLSAQQVEIKRVYSAAQPLNILLWRVLVRDIQDRECEVIVGLLDRLRAPAGHQYESLCLPLNSDYTQLFPPLKQLEQLRWFSDDWVRYDIIDDLLVVSDVRMSLGPGQYTFRFVVAERIADDTWLPIIPYQWASGHNMALLKPVLRRIWEPVPPLPLQEWAKRVGAGVPIPRASPDFQELGQPGS
ncbi:MAG TPA: metal-dependent hydrolase [Alcaligenes faecalis]|nr:metal-dependent hydrolase [Alcaligenes faecalis]